VAELRLKELRSSRKLTQADVAAHLQIARESYSRYESGEREMTYDAIILLADLFSVSVDFILGRYETNPVILNEDELNIINQYRSLDDRGQETIKANLIFEMLHAPKC
jgi:transcriptional regulator with XRE-family HTH domain